MTDEKFFAWLDGELDPAEAAQVEARVASDPELARLAEQHRAFAAKLRATFDSVLEAPVPQSLQDAATRTAEVVDLSARRDARAARDRAPVAQWAAIAATLVVGIMLGTLLDGTSNAPVKVRDNQVYAAAALDRALDHQLASAPQDGVRIGMTFRDQSGRICRSFTDPHSSGLACRAGEDWQVHGLFPAAEGQSGDYRMAAGPDPSLSALIDATIAGEPLDSAQERAAKARNWR